MKCYRILTWTNCSHKCHLPPPRNHQSSSNGTPQQLHEGSQPLTPGGYTPHHASILFLCQPGVSHYLHPLTRDFQLQFIQTTGAHVGHITSQFPAISTSHNTDNGLSKTPEKDNNQTSISSEAKSLHNRAPSTNTAGNTGSYANNFKEGTASLKTMSRTIISERQLMP